MVSSFRRLIHNTSNLITREGDDAMIIMSCVRYGFYIDQGGITSNITMLVIINTEQMGIILRRSAL